MSQTQFIPYSETTYFSELINDYLKQDFKLKPFYNRFPELSQFKLQIEEKQACFNPDKRAILVKTLTKQYANIDTSVQQNIQLLSKPNTFTITTGHQLNLFTGPLYFLYKIISAIKLCNTLKEAYPDFNFVPIYWMASEDHDFEEINFFNFKGKKVSWPSNDVGAVGMFSTRGLDDVLKQFAKVLPESGKHVDAIKRWFKKAYIDQSTLAKATLVLADALFKNQGLVTLDANNTTLKATFIPHIINDIFKHEAYDAITKTSEALKAVKADYPIQVNPREINLFYLSKHGRNRIVKAENKFEVLDTDIQFTAAAIETEIKTHPERFSPNVIMRPLYQEVILPNLCYIGGGGELAYWFQLQSYFKSQEVPFPILLLRNSALVISKKQFDKAQKLNLSVNDLFLKQDDLLKKVIEDISEIDLSFKNQKQHLKQQFKALNEIALLTDKSFIGAVSAQQRKQIKGLEYLEKRLLKAQKRKYQDFCNRAKILQDELFPNQNLQERVLNFSELYLDYGDTLIAELFKVLDPLNHNFTILIEP